MRLDAISPTTFAAGALGLLGALTVLHLLRVRLRRQTVDSLLLFRAVTTAQKPRSLGRRLSRLLSWLLGAAILMLAWTRYADARTSDTDGASRFVLVDARHLGQLDEELPLGPRGRVVVFADGESALRTSEEPNAVLQSRTRTTQGGSAQGLWTALESAAASLGAGDEIVVVGGPRELPTVWGETAIRRLETSSVEARGATDAVIENGSTRTLRCRASNPGTLAIGDATFESTTANDGGHIVFEGLPTAAAGSATLTIGDSTQTFDWPAAPRIRVALDAADSVMSLVVDACRDMEPAAADGADVVIGGARGTTPTVQLVAGVGAADRSPRRTDACPAAVSLRDAARQDTGALAPKTGEQVWIEDAGSGAPLAGFTPGEGVRIVRWLVEDASRRDVPVLLAQAIRSAANVEPQRLALDGSAAAAPIAATSEAEVEVPSRDALPWLLALAALVLLLVDTRLYHRGRLP